MSARSLFGGAGCAHLPTDAQVHRQQRSSSQQQTYSQDDEQPHHPHNALGYQKAVPAMAAVSPKVDLRPANSSNPPIMPARMAMPLLRYGIALGLMLASAGAQTPVKREHFQNADVLYDWVSNSRGE